MEKNRPYMNMSVHIRRARCLLRHFPRELHQSVNLHRVAQRSLSSSSSGTPFDLRSGPALHISPKSGLADDLLDVRVSGLLPGQRVALQAEVETECRRFRLRSEAMFQADMKGQVIVKEHASLGGTYEGVEPMGLIWSCQPVPEVAHLHPRIKNTDSRKPFSYTFQLLDRGSEGKGDILASEVIERRYLADHVERFEASCGKAVGTWFLPKQKGSSDPLPVVIELRGVGSGALEERASLLASYGYAVFAMNFNATLIKGEAPETFYFEAQEFLDVFDFISSHSRLDESRVALFGFCTGALLVFQNIARLRLPIKCAVLSSLIDTFHGIIGVKLPDGQLIDPLMEMATYTELYKKDGKTWFRCKDDVINIIKDACDKRIPENVYAPIENFSAPMLFFIPGDDQYQPSKAFTLEVIEKMQKAGKGHLVESLELEGVIEKLQKAGKGHLVESLELEGAGHLLDAPYMPICTKSSLKFPTEPKPAFTNWGGTTHLYAHSVDKSWRYMLDYLKRHLKPTESYR